MYIRFTTGHLAMPCQNKDNDPLEMYCLGAEVWGQRTHLLLLRLSSKRNELTFLHQQKEVEKAKNGNIFHRKDRIL